MSDALPGKLTRGSIVVTVTKVVTIVAGYATNVFLARHLGPDAFGLFGVVVTVLLWLELFVAEGLPLWVARTTDSAAGWRRALPRRYLLAQLALSAALVGMLLLAAPALARVFGAPASTGLFRLASVDIPIFAFYNLLLSVLIGARLYAAQSGSIIAYHVSKLAATVALVGIAGLAAVGAVLGSVTASAVGLAVTLGLLLAHGARARTSLAPHAQVTEEFSAAGDPIVAGAHEPDAAEPTAGDVVSGSVAPAVLILLQTLLFSASLWLLRALVPGDQAGYFRAASLVGQVPIELAAGFTWALYAAYAAAYRAGDIARCRHYVSQATRLVLTCSVAWAAIVAPTATNAMALLFSAEYRASGPALAVLSVGFGAGLLGIVLAPTLLIRGRGAVLLGVSAVLVVAEIALVAVLAVRLGALGAAIASGASLGLGGIALLGFVAPELDVAIVPLLARTLVPGAIVALVAALVPVPAPVWLLGWYPVLVALLAALLWAFKAVTPADLDAVRGGLS